jgi:uncharacterized protein YdaU (DUF1376 family)
MPWYIADYLADTAHLRAAQSGAYLHLIMHYWQHGGVPDNNAQLAAIARMTDPEWKKARPIIEPFFQMPGWKHKRVEEELATFQIKYDQRLTASRAGVEARRKLSVDRMLTGQQPSDQPLGQPSGQPKDDRTVNQPQPQPQEDGRDGRAGDPEKPKTKKQGLISEEAFALSTEVLALMGVDPHHPISVAAPYSVQGWFNGGWPREAIVAGVQKAMQNRGGDPPGTLKYFEKAIARAHAELTRVLPVVNIVAGETTTERPSGKAQRPGGSLIASIKDELARSIEEDNRTARHGDPVLRISA